MRFWLVAGAALAVASGEITSSAGDAVASAMRAFLRGTPATPLDESLPQQKTTRRLGHKKKQTSPGAAPTAAPTPSQGFGSSLGALLAVYSPDSVAGTTPAPTADRSTRPAQPAPTPALADNGSGPEASLWASKAPSQAPSHAPASGGLFGFHFVDGDNPRGGDAATALPPPLPIFEPANPTADAAADSPSNLSADVFAEAAAPLSPAPAPLPGALRSMAAATSTFERSLSKLSPPLHRATSATPLLRTSDCL
jgi:hypothetical protein